MDRYFTKTFFKFSLGFIALLALSFAFILASASFEKKENVSVRAAARSLAE